MPARTKKGIENPKEKEKERETNIVSRSKIKDFLLLSN